MKKLDQIAIAFFVIINTLFDLINITDSTRLSIIFFSVMYMTLMVIVFNGAYTSWKTERIKDSFNIIMGIGFMVRIGWELSKWNLPFNEYIRSVNNYEKGLLFSFLLIALLLTAISHERKQRII